MESATVHGSAPTGSRPARRLHVVTFALIVLLVGQYVLGIAYNLYGTTPTSANKIKPFSSPLLATHVVVGTLLILIAIYLVVASIRAHIPGATVGSIAGLISLVAAWISGSAFTQNGANGYSMAMGVLTAVALLCYIPMIKVHGQPRPRTQSRP